MKSIVHFYYEHALPFKINEPYQVYASGTVIILNQLKSSFVICPTIPSNYLENSESCMLSRVKTDTFSEMPEVALRAIGILDREQITKKIFDKYHEVISFQTDR